MTDLLCMYATWCLVMYETRSQVTSIPVFRCGRTVTARYAIMGLHSKLRLLTWYNATPQSPLHVQKFFRKKRRSQCLARFSHLATVCFTFAFAFPLPTRRTRRFKTTVGNHGTCSIKYTFTATDKPVFRFRMLSRAEESYAVLVNRCEGFERCRLLCAASRVCYDFTYWRTHAT